MTIAVLGMLASCSGGDRPPAATIEVDGSMTEVPDAGSNDDATVNKDHTPMDGGASDADATIADGSDGSDGSEEPDGSIDAAEEPATEPMEAATNSGPDAGVDAGVDSGSACSAAYDDAGVTLLMCGLQCINIATDPNNCGGCNQTCGTNAQGDVPGQFCDGGFCTCPSPQSVCGGQCVDTTQDPTNCGSCGHNCTGAACQASLCVPTPIAYTVQGGTLPTTVAGAIAVDSSYVYWSQAAGGGSAPGVFQKPFAGSNPIGPWPSNDPRGIAVSGHYIYWVDYTAGTVNQGSLVGGAGVQTTLATDTGGPIAITTDGTNIYWADNSAGTINQLALAPPADGGTATTIVIATGQSYPVAIAVDATSVYWVNSGTVANTGSVNKAPIGSTHAVTPIATGENSPLGIALYPPLTSSTSTPPAASTVYWTNNTNPGTVKSAPASGSDGGAPTIIASNQLSPFGITVDSLYVYWTNFDGNTVIKAPLAGGATYVVASGANLNTPTSIAVDTSNVYWANPGSSSIYKVAK